MPPNGSIRPWSNPLPWRGQDAKGQGQAERGVGVQRKNREGVGERKGHKKEGGGKGIEGRETQTHSVLSASRTKSINIWLTLSINSKSGEPELCTYAMVTWEATERLGFPYTGQNIKRVVVRGSDFNIPPLLVLPPVVSVSHCRQSPWKHGQ